MMCDVGVAGGNMLTYILGCINCIKSVRYHVENIGHVSTKYIILVN